MNAVAIIVSAGFGERLGAKIPKALVEISGKPMLLYSVETLSSLDFVKSTIVAIPASFENEFIGVLEKIEKPIKVVVGGSTRMQSVLSCISALPEDCDIIGVHDSARPLIEMEDARAVFESAEIYGASALAVPVIDTLKIVDETWIVETQSREKLWAVQTPQAFRRELFESALKNLPSGINLTDDCSILELFGNKIKIVIGKRTNIKITYPEDLAIAECILKSRR